MTHIFIFNPNSNAGGSSKKLREKLTQFSDLHYFIFIMRKNDTTEEMISVYCAYSRAKSCGYTAAAARVPSGT